MTRPCCRKAQLAERAACVRVLRREMNEVTIEMSDEWKAVMRWAIGTIRQERTAADDRKVKRIRRKR